MIKPPARSERDAVQWPRGSIVMSITIREAAPGDVQAIQNLRMRVRENVLVDPSRVTEETTTRALTEEGRGWVAMEEGRLLGFSIALRDPPRIWALFVDPEQEGRGLGQRLLQEAVDWLWAEGANVIRLSTEPNTRAERLYDQQGWRSVGTNDRGEAVFELYRPGST
jgi:GNAT superfamily N-acetyltransferase